MRKAGRRPIGPTASSGKTGRYDIGYGKPPANFQFKKGTSGNPRGRPTGQLSLAQLLKKELNKKISITENGKAGRVKKFDAIVKQIVNQSVLGHHAMMKLLLGIVPLIPDMERNNEESEKSFREFADLLDKIAAEKAAKVPDKVDL